MTRGILEERLAIDAQKELDLTARRKILAQHIRAARHQPVLARQVNEATSLWQQIERAVEEQIREVDARANARGEVGMFALDGLEQRAVALFPDVRGISENHREPSAITRFRRERLGELCRSSEAIADNHPILVMARLMFDVLGEALSCSEDVQRARDRQRGLLLDGDDAKVGARVERGDQQAPIASAQIEDGATWRGIIGDGRGHPR